MAIWVDSDTRLVVQGITGTEGQFHALGCRDYGTNVVAGVTNSSAEDGQVGPTRQRRQVRLVEAHHARDVRRD